MPVPPASAPPARLAATSAPPPAGRTPAPAAAPAADRLGAELRESVVLLLLSVLATAGLAAFASAVLTALD